MSRLHCHRNDYTTLDTVQILLNSSESSALSTSPALPMAASMQAADAENRGGGEKREGDAAGKGSES